MRKSRSLDKKQLVATLYLKGEDMSDSTAKLFSRIEGMRSSMIALQRALNSVPAIGPESGGRGESEKTAVLEKVLRTMGLSAIERFDAPDTRVPSGKRPNLLVTLAGKDNKRTFWIMTHSDIVPPGDLKEWKTDPFVLEERDGKIFGRGTEDNQQGLVASLFALVALKDSGITPECTVKLLFVADEETGSNFGIKYLLEKHPELFSGSSFALVPDAGRSDGAMIEIAEKGILWMKIRTKGKQVHASLPHLGKNAFVAGSALVVRLNELNDAYPLHDKLFDPPFSTFSPTKKEANVPNINTIPGDDVFYIDCRVLPGISLDDVQARMDTIAREIEKKYGVTIEMETVQHETSPATRADAPIIGRLARALKTVYNIEGKPTGIGGGTVGAYLRRKGIDTVVWSKIESTAHMQNECCVIDNMVGDAKVMALLMMGQE
jgi:succinyl-diaminopimelate desuccinylase